MNADSNRHQSCTYVAVFWAAEASDDQCWKHHLPVAHVYCLANISEGPEKDHEPCKIVNNRAIMYGKPYSPNPTIDIACMKNEASIKLTGCSRRGRGVTAICKHDRSFCMYTAIDRSGDLRAYNMTAVTYVVRVLTGIDLFTSFPALMKVWQCATVWSDV